MNKEANESGLLPWTKPEVRRIDAGSAEATKNAGIPDNGTPPSKDFS